MSTLKYFLILLSIVTVGLPLNFTHAAIVGKIVKVKGSATILEPKTVDAKDVVLNSPVKEDSSIVTKNASIVIVKFNDKTRMVIGPKSKVVVQHLGKQKQGIVSLLKGKLRASVDKKNKKDIKFVVKSKTASLGVRGTTFQTTFNPENNVTSLVTFKGEVAMVKKSNKDLRKKEDIKIVEKKLASKEAVVVKQGRYSGVTTNLKKATAPVKISPKQFVLMKHNDTFGVEKKKITKKEIEKEIKKIEKVYAKDKTTKDKEKGTFNKKENRYKPRSGGLVDLETGIYVPPAVDSVYDKKTKIFKVTNVVGEVSKEGDYIAPKGVKLDAKVGFVAVTKDGEEKAKVVAKLKKLNKAIAGQVVKPKIPSKPSLDDLEEDSYEKYFNIE